MDRWRYRLRSTKKKSPPRWTRFPGCGRPSLKFVSVADESATVGARIRIDPLPDNPRKPGNSLSARGAATLPARKQDCALIKRQGPAPLTRGAGPAFANRPRPEANYFVMLATTPEPTVRPPSRMAKRRPSSMAIGAISLTEMVTLSPGITISVPSGRITSPVTSVVRK